MTESNIVSFQTAAPHEPNRQTVEDVLARIEENRTEFIAAWGVKKAKRHLSAMHTVCKRLSGMFRLPLASIRLDDLVDIDESFIAFIESLGIIHESAVQYVCDKDKLLDQACTLMMWRNAQWELRKSWEPVRKALKGNSAGCGGIVDFAVRLGKRPSEFSLTQMDAWKQEMFENKRSLLTVQTEESNFRTKLRRAGLQHLIQLPLASKNPDQYVLPWDEIPPAIRKELKRIRKWKVKDCIATRKAGFAVRDVTADKIVKTLRQIYSYPVRVKRICGITSLAQLLKDEKTVTEYIDWMRNERKNGVAGILSKMRNILALAQQHPLFRGRDYTWLSRKLALLPKEPKAKVRERKSRKLIAFELLAEIPAKIRAERLSRTDLSPADQAHLVAAELWFSLPVNGRPWRQRNFREVTISRGDDAAIYQEVITDEFVSLLKLTPEMGEALKGKPAWICHFREDACKTRGEVFQLFPTNLWDLLADYLEIYRDQIAAPGVRTLWVNRAGQPMSMPDVTSYVTSTAHRFLDDKSKKLTPHLLRDIAAAYAVTISLDYAQSILWHKVPDTTWTYSGGYNASHAVIVLERHFTSLNLKSFMPLTAQRLKAA